MRCTGLLLLACSLIAADPSERDPWLQPFSTTSIWNMPIGSGAVYSPANIQPDASTFIGSDDERMIRLSASDPIQEVRIPSAWNQRWPGTSAPWQGSMPVPNALIIPDAAPPNTPNECCAFLMPDARTVIQLEPACRVTAGAHIVGYRTPDVDLFGTGMIGSHFGSGLSTLGGSIRSGELTGSDPLRHALKIELWAAAYYFYSTTVPGYRWPATNADGYANATTYGGTNPKLVAGSLLAIPPGTSAAALGITHPVALKLFAALQDYGAYIVDDTAWNAVSFCYELGVVDEIQAAHGVSLTASNGPLVNQIKLLLPALQIVDNNSANNIGGGGTPRQPLASPLADPAFPVPGTVTVSGRVGAVRVAWSDPTSDETGFEVHRRLVGDAWATLATLAANSTAWTDTSVIAGSWDYRVRLMKSPGVSTWSSVAALTLTVPAKSVIEAHFGQQVGDSSWNSAADVNGDGRVDAADVSLVLRSQGN